MVDAVTSNRLLTIPANGADVGTWDVPVNRNSVNLDGTLGGVQAISLSGSITLSSPGGTTVLAAANGSTQSENVWIKFTGTPGASVTVTFPLPGRYCVVNGCSLGATFAVIARGSGTGNVIGLPPGEPIDIINDGANVDFIGLGRVGSYVDMAVATTPAWMLACTVQPYLPCDGQTFNISSYTALGNLLGSTWGGNGATTFGVPDARSRFRAALDLSVSGSTSGRITADTGGAGFTGNTIGTTGGSQYMVSHTHTVTDPGHTHTIAWSATGATGSNSVVASPIGSGGNSTTTQIGTTGITLGSTGTGSSGNIPPAYVGGVTFIKT